MLTEERARDYLLGRLQDSDSEALENLLVEDEELFVTIRSAEDDLLDDFARGTLDERDRAAFLQRYRDPDRLRFARALARRGSNVAVLPRHRWRGWAAAAAAAIVLVAVGILFRSPQPSIPAVVPAVRTVAVTMTLATSRSAGEATKISIPRDASEVRLNVRLNPHDRFDRYAMELRSRDVVWRADSLQAKADAGDLIVSSNVPVRLLADGSYELEVRGGDEPLGFVQLEVQRAP